MTDSDKDLGSSKTCFVVGPIGDKLAPLGAPGRVAYENAIQIWEKVFEPACKVFGLSPVRADRISESGDIPEQIFTYLRDSDIVICDVTGGNANVMYELGLRHTKEKITLQIGENERLPFDVTTIRTIEFLRTEAGLIDARNALVEALRIALQGGGTPVTATRVWSTADGGSLDPAEIARASELSQEPDEGAEPTELDEQGQLELLAQGEASMEAIGSILNDFTVQLEELTSLGGEFGPQMNSSGSFANRLTLVKQLADRMQPPADEMSGLSTEFVSRIADIDVVIDIVCEQIASGVSDAVELSEFISSIDGLSASAAEANVNFAEMLPAVRQMRAMSSVLKPVSKSIEMSVNRIVSGASTVSGWAERLHRNDDPDE